MKKLLLGLSLICNVVIAQTLEWENSEVFAVNKEAYRATSIPYANEEQAIGDNYIHMTYTINKDGSLTTDVHYQALTDDLPEMMRLGMLMTLAEEYNDFTWYGRGPHENYVDRNADAFMGIWKGKGSGLSLL